MKSKIFCIGLGKTGLVSMSIILDHIGYQHMIGPITEGLVWKELNQLERLWKIIDENESFSDFPYPYLYKELYHRYPEAKFILTTRNSAEEWLVSLKKHNMRNGPTSSHLLAYGCYSPEGHDADLLNLYETHISETSDFFSDNENFLQINLAEQNAKEKLEKFLNVDLNGYILPVANSAASKDSQDVIDELMKKQFTGTAIRYAKSQSKSTELLHYITTTYFNTNFDIDLVSSKKELINKEFRLMDK